MKRRNRKKLEKRMTENMCGDRVNVVPSFDIITQKLLEVNDERLNVCVKCGSIFETGI